MSVIETTREMLGRAMRAPMLIKTSAIGGVLAGLSVGLVVSAPAGIMAGIALGAAVGIVAGIVMDQEEKRSSLRTRELDEIIGVSGGDLGIPPSARQPAADSEHERELRTWATEWLTPPPPHVG
jgi:hypothetical protein